MTTTLNWPTTSCGFLILWDMLKISFEMFPLKYKIFSILIKIHC